MDAKFDQDLVPKFLKESKTQPPKTAVSQAAPSLLGDDNDHMSEDDIMKLKLLGVHPNTVRSSAPPLSRTPPLAGS
jgi:hypothetical protein